MYDLEPWKVLTLMDLDITPRPSSYIRECCDGILVHLAPRLLLIYDRETQIEKNARQEVIEMKYSYRHWEIDDTPEMSAVRVSIPIPCTENASFLNIVCFRFKRVGFVVRLLLWFGLSL